MAEITAFGTLAADSELRYTPSGSAVLSFRMCDEKRKKKGDEWVTTAKQWLNVSIWGSLAEHLGDKLSKGVRVKVVGEMYMREYDGKNGPGVSLDVVAWGVDVKTPPKGRRAGASDTQQGTSPAANTHEPGPGWGSQQQGQQSPENQQNPYTGTQGFDPQQQGGGWNAPANDPWSSGSQPPNGGGNPGGWN